MISLLPGRPTERAFYWSSTSLLNTCRHLDVSKLFGVHRLTFSGNHWCWAYIWWWFVHRSEKKRSSLCRPTLVQEAYTFHLAPQHGTRRLFRTRGSPLYVIIIITFFAHRCLREQTLTRRASGQRTDRPSMLSLSPGVHPPRKPYHIWPCRQQIKCYFHHITVINFSALV